MPALLKIWATLWLKQPKALNTGRSHEYRIPKRKHRNSRRALNNLPKLELITVIAAGCNNIDTE